LVFRYKGKDFDPKQVATELGAEVVLNGRVLQRGNTITLSLDLVDTSTGNQMWGEQYVRDISELVVLQKEIARDVSNKLTTKLSGTDEINIAKSSTVDPEAYQLYLQGLFQWNQRTPEAAAKARQYFQQAIEKDPKYALAYAGLASSYVATDELPSKERHPRAKAAALKALELDPSLGEAHAVLGNVAFYFEWDWPAAEREFRRAIELSPNYATAHHWFGEALAAMGRFDECFAEYRKATELDPISPAISSDLAMAYYTQRQYDQAIDHLKKLIELNPGFVRSYFYLSGIYEETGKFPEAIETRRTGTLKSNPNASKVDYAVNRIRKAFAESGEPGYWKAALDLNLEYLKESNADLDPLNIAFFYSRLNEPDKAFEWLEKGFEARSNGMAMLNNPSWDKIRDDPRFADLVRRVGIVRR
jgi:tetratricopeptide (TPR) repeat protein